MPITQAEPGNRQENLDFGNGNKRSSVYDFLFLLSTPPSPTWFQFSFLPPQLSSPPSFLFLIPQLFSTNLFSFFVSLFLFFSLPALARVDINPRVSPQPQAGSCLLKCRSVEMSLWQCVLVCVRPLQPPSAIQTQPCHALFLTDSSGQPQTSSNPSTLCLVSTSLQWWRSRKNTDCIFCLQLHFTEILKTCICDMFMDTFTISLFFCTGFALPSSQPNYRP